jgi:hypothetical protein
MNSNYSPKLAALAVSITAVMLTMAGFAALSSSQDVTLSGTLTAVNVEIFNDSACTQPCTTVDVGTVNPGSSATQDIWVKNTGTVPVTLSMATSNWDPANAGSYLDLSWNRIGYDLGVGSSVRATLTLTAASDTGSLTTFSVSVTITGTQ